jgi:hypothetical protein
MKIFASFGQFYDRFKYELPRGSFGGDKLLRYFFPLADPNYTTYTRAYSLSHTLVGPLDFRVPSNDPSDNRVDPDLKPARQTEFTVGSEYGLTNNLVWRSLPPRTLTAPLRTLVRRFAGNENFSSPTLQLLFRLPVFAIGEAPLQRHELRVDKRFSNNISSMSVTS